MSKIACATPFIPLYAPTRWSTPQTIAEQIAHFELDLSSIDSNFSFPGKLASSINRLWCDLTIPHNVDHYRGSEFYFTDNAN